MLTLERMDALVAELARRIPWDRPSDALRYSAAARGASLVENDSLDDRVLEVIAFHVMLLVGYDLPSAYLLMGLLGDDGAACLAVLCSNQLLADLDSVHADQRDEWLVSAPH